jgi:hypothetical protein
MHVLAKPDGDFVYNGTINTPSAALLSSTPKTFAPEVRSSEMKAG